jgi:aspartyl-tRNA(Asn)/glutamyl-tRNA(Gln) amidotransferase subunit B
VRKPGQPLGTRREIKNLNSFKFMQQAIDFEIRWQIERIEDGHAIRQATVLFDPDTGETRAMREKEDSADYRYFPCPDLPPLVVAPEWVREVQAAMPELPRQLAERLVADYGLSEYDATILTASPATAAYFEATAKACGQGKLAANWIMGELAKRLNTAEIDIAACPVAPAQLGDMIALIAKGEISNNAGKQVLDALWDGEADVQKIVAAKGLRQIQRQQRFGRHHRRRDRCQRQDGGRIQKRQRQGAQRHGGPGHESQQRPGQPRRVYANAAR